MVASTNPDREVQAMADTTDLAQPSDDSGTDQTAGHRHQPSRLNQALAWVGIVAGGLFVVGAIFFSGYFLNYSEHMHMNMNMGMSHAGMGNESKDCCADMKPGDMKPGDHMMKPGAMGPAMMGPHSGR
jgi:hypothetical protein